MLLASLKWFAGLGIYLLILVNHAHALILNPDTLSFYGDNKGETFFTSTPTFTVETFDLFNTTGVGAEFGFYFVGSPSTLIPIFDSNDVLGSAAIDFAGGLVIDIEDQFPQSLFFGSDEPVGFYLRAEGVTVYTESSLNTGGIDVAATFPSILDPSLYMIGFEIPIAGSLTTVAYELVGGIKRVEEPGAIYLIIIGLGLIGIGKFHRVVALS